MEDPSLLPTLSDRFRLNTASKLVHVDHPYGLGNNDLFDWVCPSDNRPLVTERCWLCISDLGCITHRGKGADMETVAGIFDSREVAEHVVGQIHLLRVPDDHIALLTPDMSKRQV